MTARLTLLLGAFIAIVAFAGGCGDDDNGSDEASAETISVSTSPLSKAVYVKRANKICSPKTGNRLEELGKYLQENRGPGVSEPEVFADAVRAILMPTIEKETRELQELGAPAGDEAEIEAFLVAQQEAIDRVQGIKSVKSFTTEVEPLFAEPSKLARDYGIKACVNDY